MTVVDKIETVSIEKKVRNVLLMLQNAWWRSKKANKNRRATRRASRVDGSLNVSRVKLACEWELSEGFGSERDISLQN
jgi:hypothetical protein